MGVGVWWGGGGVGWGGGGGGVGGGGGGGVGVGGGGGRGVGGGGGGGVGGGWWWWMGDGGWGWGMGDGGWGWWVVGVQTYARPISPGCKKKHHVAIMIGGNGGRRTLRTLARYGDIWNFNGWSGMDVEVFKHKLGVLERHCEDIGRDPAEIKLTVHYPLRLEIRRASCRERV